MNPFTQDAPWFQTSPKLNIGGLNVKESTVNQATTLKTIGKT